MHHADVRQVRIRDGRGVEKGAKQGGAFIDAGGNTSQRINSLLVGDSRDGGLRGGLRFWFMVSQLVNGDNLAIMREKNLAVDCGRDSGHGIGVTTPQKNVVVKRGVYNFNVDRNYLAGKGDRKVTK